MNRPEMPFLHILTCPRKTDPVVVLGFGTLFEVGSDHAQTCYPNNCRIEVSEAGMPRGCREWPADSLDKVTNGD